MHYLTSLVLAIALFTSGCQKPANTNTIDEQLTVLLDSIRVASGYPGVVFAYVDSSGLPHPIVSGWADTLLKTPMTKDHLMHSGSTGKVLVSALVMQLFIEQQLKLDSSIMAYFGDRPEFLRIPNAQSITIRHLLQHRSGIDRYEFKEEFLEVVNKDADRVWKPEELIAFVLDDEPLFPAGEGFSYADTNYILLGMIIEKITGRKFYDLAEERVLQPLGLTSFQPTNTRDIPNMAQGYYDADSKYALGFESPFLKDGIAQNNLQWEWTGGGYAYKTYEYAQLLKFIHEGKAFDLPKVALDFYDMQPAKQIGGKYSLGVHQFDIPDLGTLVGHDGFFPGYYTIGLYHPESKQSFAMQINVTERPQLRAFFKDYVQLIKNVLSASR